MGLRGLDLVSDRPTEDLPTSVDLDPDLPIPARIPGSISPTPLNPRFRPSASRVTVGPGPPTDPVRDRRRFRYPSSSTGVLGVWTASAFPDHLSLGPESGWASPTKTGAGRGRCPKTETKASETTESDVGSGTRLGGLGFTFVYTDKCVCLCVCVRRKCRFRGKDPSFYVHCYSYFSAFLKVKFVHFRQT